MLNISRPMPIPEPSISVEQEIANTVDRLIQPYGEKVRLEETSIPARCEKCNIVIYTQVRRNISQNGHTLAIVCFLLGSLLISLYVYLTHGFKVYRHFCPTCSTFIGEFRPKLHRREAYNLLLLTILSAGLTIYGIINIVIIKEQYL